MILILIFDIYFLNKIFIKFPSRISITRLEIL